MPEFDELANKNDYTNRSIEKQKLLHLLTFQMPILTALKNKKCNGEFHALPYLSSLKEYRRYLFFFPKTLWSSFYLFYTL